MGARPGLLAVIAVAAGSHAAAADEPACSLGGAGEPCHQAGLKAGRGTPPVVAATPAASPGDSPWTDGGATPDAFRPGPGLTGRDRRAWSLAALGGVYLGFSTWAYFAWYYDQPNLDEFTIGGDGYFGENTYAGGSDKLGHAWANLVLARSSTALLRWGGWSRPVASAIGSGVAWALFLLVEVKDGYYYQFSPGDLLANTTGAALSALLVNVPRLDELIDFRVHYYPSAEYIGLVRGEYHGDPQLNSLNIAEDYSGQTYFLALHLGAIGAGSGRLAEALDYVDVGVGFHAQKYKPDAPSDAIRTQELYAGVTVNLQHVLERVTGGARHGAAGRAARIGHAVFEHMGIPYTILPVAGGERSPDR